jgi:hypothetical protein
MDELSTMRNLAEKRKTAHPLDTGLKIMYVASVPSNLTSQRFLQPWL